jgi:two-component system sensor histidine kinase KdpD
MATRGAAEGGFRGRRGRVLTGYLMAALGVAAMTGLIRLTSGAAHVANISMLYLLVVIGAALRFGRGPAILAAVLAFLAFDWCFVEPRYQFNVHNPAEWLALIMFLITATVTGQLTALLRARENEAHRREQEAAALAEASWAVASQVDRARALEEVLRRLTEVVRPEGAAIILREEGRAPEVASWSGGDGAPPPDVGADCVQQSIEAALGNRVPTGVGEPTGVSEPTGVGGAIGWDGNLQDRKNRWGKRELPADTYLPLATEQRVLGVLYLRLRQEQEITPEERRLVESLAHQATMVLERDRLTRAEMQARALAEADRLRTALLSMVSHDFRSPLASIKASVTGLLQDGTPWDPAAQRELLQGIDEETDRLNRMVGNILALSRLEADAWRPQREPTTIAEVVGAALNSLTADANRRIRMQLEPALAEVWLDPVQIVQVLHNLVENALKYSPPDSPVELRAGTRASGCQHGEALVLEVLDRGRGLAEGEEDLVFKPFYRAPDLHETAVPGVGIGLAVCRGLVEAHGGRLSAHRRAGGGAVFRITLPLRPTGDR